MTIRQLLGFMAMALAMSTSASAQAPKLADQLVQAAWTANTLKRLRVSKNYGDIVAILIIEDAFSKNSPIDVASLSAQLAQARKITQALAISTPDPDLNPTTLLAAFQSLRGTDILPESSLDSLIGELAPTDTAHIEQRFMPLAAPTTKQAFANFLEDHLANLYKLRNNASATSFLGGIITFPNSSIEPKAYLDQVIPGNSRLKDTLEAAISSGSVDVNSLTSAATSDLSDSVTNFKTARLALEQIAKPQTDFDSIATGQWLPVQQTVANAVQKVNALVSATPDELEDFDLLHLGAAVLPLSPSAQNTLNTIAQIGSTVQSTVSTVSNVATSLSSLSTLANAGLSFLTTGGIGDLLSVASLFGGGGPSNADILNAISNLSSQIDDLHHDMDDRFDRVDAEFSQLNAKIDGDFAALSSELQSQSALIIQTTNTIQSTLLSEKTILEKGTLNEIGAWQQDKIDLMDNNLIQLSAAIDRKNAGHDDLSRSQFRTLAQYFSILATRQAAEYPLSGLPTDYQFSALQLEDLGTSAKSIYALNYTLAAPVPGSALTVLGAVGGPLSARDIGAHAFVNEHIWIVAATALATMISEWPSYANEIPGLRNTFDAIVGNGKDISDLVTQLHTIGSDNGPSLSGGIGVLVDSYQTAATKLQGDLFSGFEDEISALAAARGLGKDQTTAVLNGAAFNPFFGAKYVPTSVRAFQCSGLNPAKYTYSGDLLNKFDVDSYGLALALGHAEIEACVGAIGYESPEPPIRENGHGGYSMMEHGTPYQYVCNADSMVTRAKPKLLLEMFVHRVGDPDDAAHRLLIGSATADGPEVETSESVIGNVRWSGATTPPGHNWNLECQVWRPGASTSLSVDFGGYFGQNWSQVNSAFSASSATVSHLVITPPNATGDRDTIIKELSQDDLTDIVTLWNRAAGDFISILADNTTAGAITLQHVEAIKSDLSLLDSSRAILASLVTIGFQDAIARDDVLSGLLFGTDEVPSQSDLLQYAHDCAQSALRDDCAGNIANVSVERIGALQQRLLTALKEIKAGKFHESHDALDMTLDNLQAVRCAVPTTYNGKADCGASQ